MGSHSALEDAVLLLENHLEYFQVYKDRMGSVFLEDGWFLPIWV